MPRATMLRTPGSRFAGSAAMAARSWLNQGRPSNRPAAIRSWSTRAVSGNGSAVVTRTKSKPRRRASARSAALSATGSIPAGGVWEAGASAGIPDLSRRAFGDALARGLEHRRHKRLDYRRRSQRRAYLLVGGEDRRQEARAVVAPRLEHAIQPVDLVAEERRVVH